MIWTAVARTWGMSSTTRTATLVLDNSTLLNATAWLYDNGCGHSRLAGCPNLDRGEAAQRLTKLTIPYQRLPIRAKRRGPLRTGVGTVNLAAGRLAMWA